MVASSSRLSQGASEFVSSPRWAASRFRLSPVEVLVKLEADELIQLQVIELLRTVT